MDVRTELLESAIEHFPEAVALLNPDGVLVLWNHSAEAATGYLAAELLGRAIPARLEALLLAGRDADPAMLCSPIRPVRGLLVHLKNKAGQPLNVMTHPLVLRDALGRQIGVAVLFHPTDAMEVLPRGLCSGDSQICASQAEVEERLEAVYEDFQQGGPPFGILWIAVDQAAGLRKTHGAAACAAMMEKVESALYNGLRANEGIGRWGDDEFLILSQEPTEAELLSHAHTLSGLARTADFRWWGDRLTLTISIGAARAAPGASLAAILEAARDAMSVSFQAGGNQITSAPGRQECSPS